MMAATGGVFHAYAIAVIFGAYIGIAEILPRAVIPKYVAQGSRGTAFGLYNLVVGFGFFGGGVAFGLLWDLAGIATASAYSILSLQQFQ